MKETHKPCPFCGGARILKGDRYFAICVDCGATGPERIGDKAGQKKLFADWNTRAEPVKDAPQS
jgi:Lar family restriction alleviation protein